MAHRDVVVGMSPALLPMVPTVTGGHRPLELLP